jgi:hypothetical protein
MKLKLMAFLAVCFVLPSAFATETFYMHISGQFSQDPGLSADLNKTFTDPLQVLRGKIMFSYIVQVYGDGNFFLNLILSPVHPEDSQVFHDYISSKQKRGFRGLAVNFTKVAHIEGQAHLLLGSYVEDEMDPFQQHFDLSRPISLADLSAWNDFSNQYGFAFMASSQDFQSYLQKFVGDETDFKNVIAALSQNNMAAMDSSMEIYLENGTKVSAAFEASPFVPFRFFRNCYSTQHENGMCYTPSALP